MLSLTRWLVSTAALTAAAFCLLAAEPPAKPGTLPPVKVRGVSFELVRIPAGEFLMGSENAEEKPRHGVRLGAFDLGKTEVTVRQFRTFTDATGYRTDAEKEGWGWACCWSREKGLNWRNPGFAQSDDNPVIALSWQDAAEFTKWLSAETGQKFRLPTESEWEYAARAGDSGEVAPDLDGIAWYKLNSGGKTHPVAQKPANPRGLHDILGNGWEWVEDVWASDYNGAPSDGSARLTGGTARRYFAAGEGRILRGGGWGLDAHNLRFADRPAFGLHDRCNNSGFRLARTVAPSAGE